MVAKETKRQHFVPETYLRKFSVAGKKKKYQIYAANKSDIEKIFLSNTENVCVYKDLYTLPGKTAEERMLIERFYGETYETNYNRIYDMLTDDSYRNHSESDNKLIVSTLITMLFRTTRLLSVHNDLMNRVFFQAVSFCEQSGKDYFTWEDQKIMLNGRSAKELMSDHKRDSRVSQVLTQLKVALRLIEIRKDNSISVVKIKTNGPEFITSDNPVTLYNFDTKHIAPFDPKNVISLPLNKQYKVIIYPFKNLGYISRLIHDDVLSYSEVMTTDYEQFSSSENFILGSEKGLNDFIEIRRKADTVIEVSDHQNEELKRLQTIARDLGLLP